MADNPLEIPQTLRDLSEQNLKQAHAAYEQFAAFVTRAIEAWTGAMPANPMTAGFKDVQECVMEFAMENAAAAFAFAGRICKAATPQDLVMLQTEFAQERMQAFAAQTQHLVSLMGDVFQKPERGVAGAGTGALPSHRPPSNSVVMGFKDVRDQAVSMAKRNAESAAALLEKITKSQNFQELLTLQAAFAQDQMKVFVTQAQELQKLIEEALHRSAHR